ncbi:hypothetical protein TI39_contig4164g00009 [Zymoseptoria brevis]|uniref:Expansin-like EG45 domain-containing protein n=1 Tax=Zymoseptoria brevis TaxID=1047168 RepID=A0A0F4GCG6_9PEZI|nr:hypothetical protein TI39_contig4164g00009 [Zymoseptoria brevis]
MHVQRSLTAASAGAIFLASGASASVLPGTTENKSYKVRRDFKTGLGTRYGKNCREEDCWQSGACAFTNYKLPSTIDGSTCVSEAIWDSSAHCGGCIKVTYKGKTITIMVTNKTDGDANHLDMPPATWSKLTNGMTGGGVDGIEWDWVTCPITAPLTIHMHGGSSQYWFAATVENATLRTTKMEVSTDDGKTWKGTKRDTNNFFVVDGVLPTTTAWVKVTSESGSTVLVENVKLESASTNPPAITSAPAIGPEVIMTAPPVLVPVLDCAAADPDEVILSDVSSAAADEVMLPRRRLLGTGGRHGLSLHSRRRLCASNNRVSIADEHGAILLNVVANRRQLAEWNGRRSGFASGRSKVEVSCVAADAADQVRDVIGVDAPAVGRNYAAGTATVAGYGAATGLQVWSAIGVDLGPGHLGPEHLGTYALGECDTEEWQSESEGGVHLESIKRRTLV